MQLPTPQERRVLGIGASVLAACVLAGAGYWYWTQYEADKVVTNVRSAISDGRTKGKALTETGCLQRAVAMRKSEWQDSIANWMGDGVWLSACLETSTPQDDFCAEVPRPEEVAKLEHWTAAKCARSAFSGPECPILLQNVANYCTSETRAEKLRRRGHPIQAQAAKLRTTNRA